MRPLGEGGALPGLLQDLLLHLGDGVTVQDLGWRCLGRGASVGPWSWDENVQGLGQRGRVGVTDGYCLDSILTHCILTHFNSLHVPLGMSKVAIIIL